MSHSLGFVARDYRCVHQPHGGSYLVEDFAATSPVNGGKTGNTLIIRKIIRMGRFGREKNLDVLNREELSLHQTGRANGNAEILGLLEIVDRQFAKHKYQQVISFPRYWLI